jgi:serine/threonine-protein kinase
MVTSPGTPSDAACLGAFEPIQAAVYQGSGYTAVRSLGLRAADPPKRVFAGAVEFPSAENAHAFVRTSAGNTCGTSITNEAGQVAEQMAAKVTP